MKHNNEIPQFGGRSDENMTDSKITYDKIIYYLKSFNKNKNEYSNNFDTFYLNSLRVDEITS